MKEDYNLATFYRNDIANDRWDICNKLVSYLTLLLSILLVYVLIVIIYRLRKYFGHFFAKEVQRLAIILIVFVFSYISNVLVNLTILKTEIFCKGLFRYLMFTALTPIFWEFLPIMLIYYLHYRSFKDQNIAFNRKSMYIGTCTSTDDTHQSLSWEQAGQCSPVTVPSRQVSGRLSTQTNSCGQVSCSQRLLEDVDSTHNQGILQTNSKITTGPENTTTFRNTITTSNNNNTGSQVIVEQTESRSSQVPRTQTITHNMVADSSMVQSEIINADEENETSNRLQILQQQQQLPKYSGSYLISREQVKALAASGMSASILET